MKIIYLGIQRSNYNFSAELSFEHYNFYESLKRLEGVEVIYFPYERFVEIGREKGNQELLNLVKKEKPDLFFAFMFTDELLPEVLEELKKYTVTLAWFADDHWRFDNYSRYYAPYFSWVVTTYSKAVEQYRGIGVKNVIHSQWAANINLYKPNYRGSSLINVSFVGGWSRPRQKIIFALKKAVIDVKVYGGGWSAGKINEEEMIKIFSNSKINLALNPAPGYFNKNSLGRLFFKRSRDKIVPDFNFYGNFRTWLNRGIRQIKARHFEIPACGGFLITETADNLGDYYDMGKEIAVYKNVDDLIAKIKYFLKNDAERQKIASAGYQRTIRDHTYKKRFTEIFKTIGLFF